MGTPKPTESEIEALRERAFEAVREWLNAATSAGKSLFEILRDLQGMMKK